MELEIIHNRTEGTLLHGSRKGDGVFDIARKHGLRFSRNVDGLYLPRSRDKRADRWTIDRLAEDLQAAGHEVTVTVDDATAGRTFAEAEADRTDRAEERADRFAERADRNTDAGEGRWARTRERMSHIPMGQPILVGHHSEKRHRRILNWADTQDRKAVEELKKGKYWAGRAESAERHQQHREDPGTTRRRIDKLEADRRRITAVLDGWTKTVQPGGDVPEGAKLVRTYDDGHADYRVWPTGEYKASREADVAQLDDEIAYWKAVLEKAAERGVKLWSKADFEKGDFVIIHGTAVEVMRVNAKSVTIPWAHYWITRGPVATVAQCGQINQGGKLHTDTVPYDKVQGRMSAAEALAEGLTVGQAKELIGARIREARGDQS